MKYKNSLLLATAAVACFVASTAEAAKPTKRTLVLQEVIVAAGTEAWDVTVKSDCNSENANVEYNVPVTVTYTIPDDELLEGDQSQLVTESDIVELELTIPLQKVFGGDEICDGTTGSTSFLLSDIGAAIEAYVNSVVPEGLSPDSVDIGCASVEAKAWTTSNSTADSKPMSVPVPCEVE